MSIMAPEIDAKLNIIFDAVDKLSVAKKKTKLQAILPAEIMRFVVRFREGFIRSRTTSDTIAVLVIIAKNYLESLTIDEKHVIIERAIQLKNVSLESWKIQSVMPEETLKYVDSLSDKLELKQLSPVIAILSIIGAQKIAELTYEKDFWMSFYSFFESAGDDPGLPEWYLSWLKNEKNRISKLKVSVGGFGKVPDKILGMLLSNFPHIFESEQEGKAGKTKKGG
jgi:hypothetical protein